MSDSDQRALTDLLAVTDLTVRLRTRQGLVPIVEGLTFSVGAGECHALVGESGSGKSVTARAIMGLLPPTGQLSGRIGLGGQQSIGPDGRYLGANLRGTELSIVFQNAAASLNPVLPVGWQIAEMFQSTAGCRERSLAAGPSICSSGSGSLTQPAGHARTRISSPVGCASGRRSPWRSAWGPSC